MSFPMVPSQYGKSNFGHYEELDADFFDQFLTFEANDNISSVELRQIGSSSNGHASSKTPDILLDWPRKSWNFGEDAASSDQGLTIYSEITGRAAISDSELLNLEDMNLNSTEIEAATHHSLPSSPSQINGVHSKKRHLVGSMSRKTKKSTSNLEKSLRSPIRKSKSSPKIARTKSSTLENEVDLLKFEFDFEKIPSNISGKKLPNCVEYSVETPPLTPLLDSESSRRTSSRTRSSDDSVAPVPIHEFQTHEWSRVPFSTTMNPYASPNKYTSEDDAPIWWNHASTAPMAQPSPTALHVNPQRATKSLAYQLQNDLSRRQNETVHAPFPNSYGLALQMAGGTSTKSFSVESSTRQQGYFGSSHSHHQLQNRPNGHPRSLQYPGQYPPLSRRNAPPASESESPSPKSYQVRKRRTPRKERSSVPRTPNLGGEVDFVNFTPSDSKKILTGVAPSGSSKTKARREKEAMEKRRKLSQAAIRAVRAAGGDVESLLEQGLLV